MSKLLNTGKMILRESAVEFYTLMSEDLEIDKNNFRNHFANLGTVLFLIEEIKSFSELITKLEEGLFEEVGYFPGDEDMLECFLEAVEKHK